MLAIERRNQIEQMITKNGSVLVIDLAKQFEVTTETIRGDLLKLEKQGILVRTYGGATLAESTGSELGIMERNSINSEEKKRIGKRAAEMVRNGETIFLDASTSAWHMSRHLQDKKNITVITNASKIAAELAECDNIRVICTGGMLNPKNMSYTGRIAEKTIRENYYANRCFFSCRGVSMQRGLIDISEEEAEIKRAMVECSENVTFLCDHAKIGKISVPRITDFSKIDCFITDVNLSVDWKNFLESYDIRVIEV